MRGVLKSIFTRGIVVYFLVAGIFYFAVDYQKVAVRTVNFLMDESDYVRHFAQGQAEYDEYHMREGLRYFKNILSGIKGSFAVYSALGYCYFHLGEMDKARDSYLKAIELNDQFFGLYHNLGMIEYQSGRYERAVEYFDKALASSLDLDYQYLFVLDPYRARPYEFTDNAQMIRLLGLKKGYDQTHKMRVSAYLKAGLYEDMLEAAVKAAGEIQSERGYFLLQAGVASYHLGAYDRAVPFLKQSFELIGPTPAGLEYLSYILAAQKQKDLSDKYLEQSRQLRVERDQLRYPDDEDVIGLYYYIPLRVVTEDGQKEYIFM